MDYLSHSLRELQARKLGKVQVIKGWAMQPAVNVIEGCRI